MADQIAERLDELGDCGVFSLYVALRLKEIAGNALLPNFRKRTEFEPEKGMAFGMLVDVLQEHGLDAAPKKVDWDDLRLLTPPAVLVYGEGQDAHYCVWAGYSGSGHIVVDPLDASTREYVEAPRGYCGVAAVVGDAPLPIGASPSIFLARAC